MDIKSGSLLLEDRWIIGRLNDTIADVDKLMQDYQFGEAQRQIHDFLWGDYCDWYIEMAKIRLGANSIGSSPVPVLIHILEKSLRLLHPFIPFITEELWQNIKKSIPDDRQSVDSIMVAAYPKADKKARDREAERVMAAVIEIVRSIRNVRAEHNVEINRQIDAAIYITELKPAITAYTKAIGKLAKANVKILDKKEEHKAENTIVLVLKEAEVVIPMASMVDLQAEQQKLRKEIEQVQANVNRLEKMLANEDFIMKAPQAVVDKEKTKLLSARDSLGRLEEHLKRF
jgi:valyl-tRNA synthetase